MFKRDQTSFKTKKYKPKGWRHKKDDVWLELLTHLEFPKLWRNILSVALHRDVVSQGFPLPQDQILASGLCTHTLNSVGDPGSIRHMYGSGSGSDPSIIEQK
jgi:hypothetical protein